MKHTFATLLLVLACFAWAAGDIDAVDSEQGLEAANSESDPAVSDVSSTLATAEYAQSRFYRGMTSYLAGDYREAAKRFREAAGQGHANAQFTLGVMYYQGDGVDQDYKEAIRWYRLAAEQGLVPAQFNVGMMHYQGDGVVQDYKEAAKWYHRVAEQGVAEAQFNLGMMYQLGQGVTQDNLSAYMWADLAASNEHTKAAKLRSTLAQALTPADISKAQQLAKQCMASNYKAC